MKLANEGKNDEALGALEALETEGYGAYPLLARMRAATVLAGKGDFAGAVAAFDAVAATAPFRSSIRDMASLRAALILVDHGTYADVSARARGADRRHQHAASLGARGARPVGLEGRQARPTR